MAEYIEREALLREIERRERFMVGDKTISVDALKRFILNRPAADVAPVVHGQWKEMHYEGGILDGTNFDRCSVCGYERVFDDPAFKTVFKYCPNCGAKMDGGDSDEAD